MIAYNRASLDNKRIREQADEAFAVDCITREEKTKIELTYPVDFYTPNIIICFGLFVLTVIIATCTLGIFFLMSSESSGSGAALLFFFALVCYGSLEYVIQKRRHFRSGVDYALMWMSAGLLCAAIYLTVDNLSAISVCITVFIASLLFTIRFANRILALICFIALLVLIFNITSALGRTAQTTTPFIIMAVSIGTWFICSRMCKHKILRHYRECLTFVKTATLVGFYAAGNYFVVRTLANDLQVSSLSANGGISMGWFFWTFTVATPLLYTFHGIRKKNAIFLWTGLGLIIATVFTVRHYYRVLPVEWAMLLGGIVLIVPAYALIKYLRIPRHGYTSLESDNKNGLENLHIESLVIAKNFAGPTAAPVANNDFQFGGGSGGGGGAGGQY